MVLHKIDTASKQLFQIRNGGNMVIKLSWHLDEEVHIAPVVMLVPCNRAEQPHRRYAKTLLEFPRMAPDSVNVFLSCFHFILISLQIYVFNLTFLSL